MSEKQRIETRTTFHRLVAELTKDPDGFTPDQVGMIRDSLALVVNVLCDINRIADAAEILSSPPREHVELKITGSAISAADLERIRQAVQDLPADGVVRVARG